MSVLPDRIAAKIDVRPSGCWEWKGARDVKGYGRISRRYYGESLAHRFVWIAFNGPIPPGMVPDHLCRNPGCVNPRHMEIVTPAENTRRGVRWQLRKTACPAGHAYDIVDAHGHRRCSICLREQRRAYKRRQRATA